jgi:hypothetical protein
MNKKRLPARRLVLNRETLLRLDNRKLRIVAGDGRIQIAETQNDCTSPLCGPTTCACAETA